MPATLIARPFPIVQKKLNDCFFCTINHRDKGLTCPASLHYRAFRQRGTWSIPLEKPVKGALFKNRCGSLILLQRNISRDWLAQESRNRACCQTLPRT